MRTIYKYELAPNHVQELRMPVGAVPLAVQSQRGKPQLWAMVDPDQPQEAVAFAVIATGEPMPEDPGAYVSTFQLHDLGLVFHVFVKRGPS